MNISSGTWVGLVVGLALLTFAAPAVARKLADLDGDPRMFRLAMWGASLKLAAAPFYIYVVEHFYNGVADAFAYSAVGAQLSNQIRDGHFPFHGLGGATPVDVLTGFLYAAIGVSRLASFFVFAFLAFLGLTLFYRAFRTALPEASSSRYAKLLFFLPSLIFWTSAVSKDALVTLTLGAAALGAARILTNHPRGFLLAALG